jgi:4-amino-4-deoxy-L-arabinose transferase-like glycosyltransferase
MIFIVVTGIALIIRLIYLLTANTLGLSAFITGGDAPLYIEAARGFLAGQGYQLNGYPTAFHMPGYPLFLAAVYAVFGQGTVAVGVVQAVLGAVTAGIVGAIAMRVAGAIAGAVAGLIVAIYPHLLMWTGVVVTEVLFVTLAMLALWLLIEGQIRGSWRWFAGAGLVLAAGGLTRSQLLAYVPVAAAVAWGLTSGRQRWVRAGWIILAPVVFTSLWIARNALVIGAVTLSTQGTEAIWYGNNPNVAAYHRGGYAYEPPLPQPAPPGLGTDMEAERSAVYGRAVRDYLSDHPLSVVEDMPLRLWNMWRPVFAGASARNWLVIGGSYLIVLALSLAGLTITLRRRAHPGVRYVQFYVLTLALFHALVIGEIRYRMPIEPALAVFAGIAVAHAVGALLPGRLEVGGTLAKSRL